MWTACVRSLVWILTQQIGSDVGLANSIWWTVGVIVGKFVGSTAFWLSIWRANTLLGWTDTIISAYLVFANGRSVANSFGAVVNRKITSQRIAFEPFPTRKNSRMLLRTAYGIIAAYARLTTRIDTHLFGKDLTVFTVLIVNAFN